MNKADEILEILVAGNYQSELFGDLRGFKSQSSAEYIAFCPFHDDQKTPNLNISKVIPVYHCWACGAKGNYFTYLEQTKGLSFIEALKELADVAGVTLDNFDNAKYERERSKAALLETALSYFREQLFNDTGKETLEYLKNRGYSEAEVKGMELGYFPGAEATEQYLAGKGYSDTEINEALKHIDYSGKYYREDYKAVIPERNHTGKLVSLWGRLTRKLEEGEKESDKYKPFTEAVKKTALLNIDRARGADTLILVEGYLDPLIAGQRGFDNVVSIGGTTVYSEQLDLIERLGVKYIYLALDNDNAGQDGTVKAINEIHTHRPDLKTFVVEYPDGYKDLDQLLTESKDGAGQFKKVYENARSGVAWVTERIIAGQDIETHRGKQQAFDEIKGFAERLVSDTDTQFVLDTARDKLGILPEIFEKELQDSKARKAKRDRNREFTNILKDGLNSRDFDPGAIMERLKTVNSEYESEAERFEPDGMAEYEEHITTTPEGLKTGYPELDKFISIPQAQLTIVAGRPKHGKSSFMLNLCLRMLDKYPDKRFLFFSYEMPKGHINDWALNILSGKQFGDGTKNLEQLKNYMKGRLLSKLETRESTVEDGYEKLTQLKQSGRLWVIDKSYYVEDLTNKIDYVCRRYDDIGAIFIDYIQKVPIRGKYPTRQSALQEVSAQLLRSAKDNQVPLILGAQFNREVKSQNDIDESRLREAGDIEQDANLILALWNEAKSKQEEENKAIESYPIDLGIYVLKQRFGVPYAETNLRFHGPLLTVYDPSEGK